MTPSIHSNDTAESVVMDHRNERGVPAFLSKYGECPTFDCKPQGYEQCPSKRHRGTHFLAIRLKSPGVWDQASAVQEEMRRVNPYYGMTLTPIRRLHITLAVVALPTQKHVDRMLAEVEHIKQIVDFFFDNSRPCRDMSKSPCRFQLKGLNTIRGDVLYLDVNKDDDYDRLRCCVLNIRKHLRDCNLLVDSPYSWVFHSTLAKKAAANWLLQSSNKLRNKEHLLKFTQPAINLINRNLYGTEDPHTYGDYLVEEIELNEMGWDTTYYNTISVIPIFCSNSEVPIPANFHPIPKYEREAENTDELYGKLPQRKDNDVLCPFCHLHFPSERQCNRHQKIHERRSAAHAMPAEEMELVTKDGSLLLTREEYEAVRHYLPDTHCLETTTIKVYIPSLVEMWKLEKH